MSVLIKMLNAKQIETLRKVFVLIDKDATGMISIDELREALHTNGHQMTCNEIKQIMDNVDYAGNGKINYSEFLAATIEVKSVLTDDRLWALFKYFDTDNSGYITG